MDLLGDGGLVGGDLDEKGHVAAIRRDLDFLDDAEGNDVAAETGVFDHAKLFADLGVGEGGCAHGEMGRARNLARATTLFQRSCVGVGTREN